MSLATVYNALEAMCRAGMCRKLPTTSGSIRYDADTSDHPHLRLRENGAIEDVPHDLGHRLIQNLPQDIQRQADSPWFKGWLQFHPAAAMKRVKQPVFVLHGALDREVPPINGERLASLAKERRGTAGSLSARIVVPGVNHLLVPANTGDPDEYETLASTSLSTDVVSALTGWLATVLK